MASPPFASLRENRREALVFRGRERVRDSGRVARLCWRERRFLYGRDLATGVSRFSFAQTGAGFSRARARLCIRSRGAPLRLRLLGCRRMPFQLGKDELLNPRARPPLAILPGIRNAFRASQYLGDVAYGPSLNRGFEVHAGIYFQKSAQSAT